MINQSVLDKFQRAVCGVGYLRGSLSDFSKDPFGFSFQILGTGLLIRDNMVITCRHVIRNDTDEKGNPIPPNSKGAIFLDLGQGRSVFASVKQSKIVPEPVSSIDTDWDVGFLEIAWPKPPLPQDADPVYPKSRRPLQIGQNAATLGYLLGNELLKRDEEENQVIGSAQNRRLGPVFLQGCLSAVVPHHSHSPEKYEELYLQLISERCMSGAPVFDPESGEILGMIHANVDYDKQWRGRPLHGLVSYTEAQMGPSVTLRPIMHSLGIAKALPITKESVDHWLQIAQV